jgi:hypothetical protein
MSSSTVRASESPKDLIASDEKLREAVKGWEASEGKPWATRAPQREALLARVVELAEDVPKGDRKARQRFIRSLGTRAWIKGETLPALARAWERSMSVIELDASVAWGAVLVAADEDDRAIFWAEAHRNIEAAAHAREEIMAALKDIPVRNAADLRSIGESVQATIGAVDKTLTTLGRAAGTLSSDSNRTVQVSIILDDRGNVRPEIASLLEVIRGALQPHPEAMTAVADALDVWIRDACIERLAELGE